MKEASDNTNNYAEFFIVYDRVNWLLSGHDANEWDEYQEILAATRRERGDRLYEVNFDLAKYQEWLGDRKNSFALQKEWAQYMAFAPKPLPLEQLVANYDKKFP
ncbi:MAG: hypothetical protein LBN32_01040, partial [Helicobacteraceae bacterium]|nr:hypothetical protein [Helicobacteraceae bacterium]